MSNRSKITAADLDVIEEILDALENSTNPVVVEFAHHGACFGIMTDNPASAFVGLAAGLSRRGGKCLDLLATIEEATWATVAIPVGGQAGRTKYDDLVIVVFPTLDSILGYFDEDDEDNE